MSKHYTILHEPVWTGNGCDCCEDTYWDNYNCADWDYLGSAEGIEEVKINCIYDYLIRELLDEEVLNKIIDILGITYEIKEGS